MRQHGAINVKTLRLPGLIARETSAFSMATLLAKIVSSTRERPVSLIAIFFQTIPQASERYAQ